jgi:hypothetical protein
VKRELYYGFSLLSVAFVFFLAVDCESLSTRQMGLFALAAAMFVALIAFPLTRNRQTRGEKQSITHS